MSWTIGPCPTTLGCLERESAYGTILAEIVMALEERDAHARAHNAWYGGPPFEWYGTFSDDVRDLNIPTISADYYDRQHTTLGVKKIDPHVLATKAWQVRDWMEEGGPWGFSTPDFLDGWGYTGLPKWKYLTTFLTHALGYSSWDEDAWGSGREPLQPRALEELRKCIEALQYCYVPGVSYVDSASWGYNTYLGTGANPTAALADWNANKALDDYSFAPFCSTNIFHFYNAASVRYETSSKMTPGAETPHPSLGRGAVELGLVRSTKVVLSLRHDNLNWPDGPWTASLWAAETAYPEGSGVYDWAGWSQVWSDSIPDSDGWHWSVADHTWGGSSPRSIYLQLRGPEVLPTPPSTPFPDGNKVFQHAGISQAWPWEYGNYTYGNPYA